MSTKPEVVLEFDLEQVVFMKMPPAATSGSVAGKETLTLADPAWPSKVAIYAVIDTRVVPIAIPDHARVEIVVSR